MKSPKKKITIDELPAVPKDSVLASLSKGFKNYLKDTTFRDFFIPPNTKLGWNPISNLNFYDFSNSS